MFETPKLFESWSIWRENRTVIQNAVGIGRQHATTCYIIPIAFVREVIFRSVVAVIVSPGRINMCQDTKLEYFCPRFILLPFFHGEIFCLFAGRLPSAWLTGYYTQTGNLVSMINCFSLTRKPVFVRGQRNRGSRAILSIWPFIL